MRPEIAAGYTLATLQELLGMSRGDILGFIKAGFIAPGRGARNAYRFGFQDVVLLRTARDLQRADVPTSRIKKSLKRLRALLPETVPLTGLRITAIGDDIAVVEGGRAFAAETGQLLFDFEVATGGGAVLTFPDAARRMHIDRPQAIASTNAEAFVADGARLVDAQAFDEALAVYEAGIAAHPDDGVLHYNRAVVLEDLARPDDALDAYRQCLAVDADFADAHWNLARLYEERGVDTLALRHFSAYRRLRR